MDISPAAEIESILTESGPVSTGSISSAFGASVSVLLVFVWFGRSLISTVKVSVVV